MWHFELSVTCQMFPEITNWVELIMKINDLLPQMMERLYQVCNLVHADLSEYNMLWHQGQVWFIDVSQSVEPNHPHGLEFLLRDCTNVSTVSVTNVNLLALYVSRSIVIQRLYGQ